MYRKLLVIIYYLSFCLVISAQRLVLWDMEAIENIKNNNECYSVKKNIIKKADEYLTQKAVSVTDREKSFAPDKHHYESISIYRWPNPENPNGPWIRKDGIVNPESNNYDRVLIGKMKSRVEYLSIAYYLTLDAKYYDAATEQIRVWFINKDTYMYPVMEYGQITPGHDGNKGHEYGLIEMYAAIHPVLESVRLLNNITKIDDYTYKEFQKWCKDFVMWCETSELGKKEKNAPNNHGIALDVTMLNMALFAGYSECVDRINNEFMESRIKTQIADDGSMPKEAERATAYHYHIYNLTHIIDYCLIRESLNKHYYKENKKYIDSAVDYLLSYVNNRERWPYKEIGDWNKLESELLFQVNRMHRLKGAKKYKRYQQVNTKVLSKIIN